MEAAARASERESLRRQRELERQHREIEKLETQERAALEVDVYLNHMDRLLTLHKDCSEAVDWAQIASVPIGCEPTNDSENESAARSVWQRYRPSLWDRITFGTKKKQQRLLENIREAKRLDEKENETAVLAYRDQVDAKRLADRIAAGDPSAFSEALQGLDLLQEIIELGSTVDIAVTSELVVDARLQVHGDDVIPADSQTLLKSGKVSVKTLSKTKFNEYYQDHVCSSVLRIAREVFAAVPAQMILITASDALLNSQTGRIEDQAILSVAVPRKSLQRLNLAAIDPSDAMKNFLHRMNFKKATGFSAVSPLTPSELPSP